MYGFTEVAGNDHEFRMMKFRARYQSLKQVSLRRAVKLLRKQCGLTKEEQPFFYGWFKEKARPFLEDGAGGGNQVEWLKQLSALLSFAFGRFAAIAVPLPEKLRDETGLTGSEFTLAELPLFDPAPAVTWCLDFEKFEQLWERFYIEGRGNNDVDDDPENFSDLRWQMKDLEEDGMNQRLDLAEKFSKDFIDHLKGLLGVKPKDARETLDRNAGFRQMASEVSRWPDHIKRLVRLLAGDDIAKLRAPRGFPQLCIKTVRQCLYNDFEYDPAGFQKQCLDFYWQRLYETAKDENQKQIMKIIRYETMAMI